jgi:hypothetical protein
VSDFDDFNEFSLVDAGDIIGREGFTIVNTPGDFAGILNEYGSVKSIEIGGIIGEYTATLVCELDQFDELDGPLERTLDGRTVIISGRKLKITRTFLDGSSLTLGLSNPSGKK